MTPIILFAKKCLEKQDYLICWDQPTPCLFLKDDVAKIYDYINNLAKNRTIIFSLMKDCAEKANKIENMGKITVEKLMAAQLWMISYTMREKLVKIAKNGWNVNEDHH